MNAPTYSDRYKDPGATAAKQLELIAHWGTKIAPPARVLEVGCADGFVTVELARAGYQVTAWDVSEEMIENAAKRLGATGVNADLAIVDITSELPSGEFDVVACLMRNFFAAIEDADPAGVLTRLAALTRRKLLVDCNPRVTSLKEAQRCVRNAGFPLVDWRPMIVPQRLRLPGWVRRIAERAEVTPVVRRAVAAVRFHAVIKGERESG